MGGKLGDFGQGRGPEDDAAQQEHSLPERSQEDLIQQLLNVLYTHGDRQAAIGAAARAVMSLQHSEGEFVPVIGLADAALQPPKGSPDPGMPLKRANSEGLTELPPSQDSSGNSKESSALSVTTDRNTCVARNAPEFVLSNFPGCKRLEDAYRKIYHIPNKTPLSVLYEYASRLNLTLVFEEMQESAGPGPFMMQTMLKDPDGNMLYRPGIGMARAKKDAKQLAAATLLEYLLEVIPFQDLLYKSDKQQQMKDLQESRMRWPPMGKGRGASGRPGCRPGLAPGLAPTSTVGQHPVPGQANLPYGLHPALQAMYDAPHSQRNMLPSGMPGSSGHFQQAGGQASAYSSNRPPLQGGDSQYSRSREDFGMQQRDPELANSFLSYAFGPNMNALGAVRGNAAMLEAGMAALKHEASQQQQQRRLVDAHSSALLPQDFVNYGLQQGGGSGGYPGGMYLDPQVPSHSSALEDLLRWSDDSSPAQTG